MATIDENDYLTRYGANPHSQVLAVAANLPQDEATKILKYSMMYGEDPAAVAANVKGYESTIRDTTDWDAVRANAPLTSSFLYDPLNMAATRSPENVQTLSDWEALTSPWQAIKEGIKSGTRDLTSFVQQYAPAMASMPTFNNYTIPVEDRYGAQTRDNGGPLVEPFTESILNSDLLKPTERKFSGKLGQYAFDVYQMVPQIVAQAAAFASTGGLGSTALMGAQISGNKYQELKEKKVDYERAFLGATANAVAQAPLEQIGLAKIFKKLPGTSLANGREILEKGFTEGLTQMLQQYPDEASSIWAEHPKSTVPEMAKMFTDNLVNTTKEGAYQGLVAMPFGFLGGGIHLALEKKANELYIAQREQVQQILANSELIKQSPELLEKFADHLEPGATVSIDPDALVLLQGEKPEIVKQLGITPEQIKTAVANGEMVEIPQGRYDVAAAKNPEIHEELKNDIAASTTEHTTRELNEKEAQHVANAQTEVETQADNLKDARDEVYQSMVSAGMKKDVAKAATVALVSNARVMNPDNPAQYLREKAPEFRNSENIANQGLVSRVKQMIVPKKDQQATARGSIQWENGKSIINIFKNHDPSTVIHELVGHHFFNNLIDEGVKETAPDWLKADRKTALAFAGIPHWDNATKDEKITAHEKFAQAAEKYLAEGKAPSIETRSMFQRFAEWIKNVYASVKGPDVELTDDVRGVFDRMLASHDEIAELEALEDYHKRLPADIYESLPEAQKTELDRSILKAREEAENIVQNQLMGYISADNKVKLEEERSAATERFTNQVKSEALYKAADMVKEQFKKDAKTIASRYKNGKLDQLQEMEFEYLAEQHGFSSGDELATKLLTGLTEDKEVDSRVNNYMKKYTDLLTDKAALREEARKAMYNDAGALLLATEHQIIQEKLTGAINRAEANKQIRIAKEKAQLAARESLGRRAIAQAINIKTYISAERRAAEKATQAMERGDFAKANQYKEVQLLNHAMVQESINIKREFDQLNKYMKRQQQSDKKTWIDQSSFDQAADLLSRFGFRRKDFDVTTKLETLAAYVTRQQKENLDMISIPEWIYGSNYTVAPRDMNISQYRDVIGAIRNIKQIARAGVNADAFVVINNDGVKATSERLIDTANKNAKDILVDQPEKERIGTITSLARKFKAGMVLPSRLFQKLDGMKDFGDWAKTIYYSMNDAQNQESRLMRKVYTAMDAAFEDEGIDKKQRQIDANKLIYIEEWNKSVTKQYLRTIILNMGSESNKQRLFSSNPVGISKGWNETTVPNVLGKYLTESDFRLANKLWKAFNLYDDYNAMVTKMTGFALPKVEAAPFEIKLANGTTVYLNGGYYPLKQDSRASIQAELNAEKAVNEGYVGVMPYPNSSASKSRTQLAHYAVDLDFTNIYGHVKEVAHDIAFRPVMHDINKLMRQDGVKDILRRKLGDEGYKSIVQWQKDIASGKDAATSSGFLDAAANVIRQRAVVANLLYRPTTVLQNPANVALYGDSVEGFSDKDAMGAYLRHGIADYIPNALTNTTRAQELREFVYSKSVMMRDKMENPDFSLRELHGLGVQDNVLSRSQNDTLMNVGTNIAITHEKVLNFASDLLAWTDQITDVPMWLGAYGKALAEGKSENDAIRFADTVIERSTGTGRKIDTTLLQRGSPTARLFTMFMTFMNTQYNRWASEFGILAKEKDIMRFLKFAGIRYLMFGLMSAAVSNWPDDDESWGEWFIKDVLEWPLGMYPVGGKLVQATIDSALGFKTYGFQVTPIQRQLENISKMVPTTVKAIKGEKPISEALETDATAMAFLFKYPDQFNDWFWNAYDIAMGEMQARPSDLMRRRPRNERH